MIGITLCLLALSAGHPDAVPVQKRAPVRTFVYTARATSGVPAPDEQGRLDSVEDLADLLRHRKSDFTLVERAEDAEVTVEVMNREEREVPQGGFGGASMTRFRETIVRLRVRSGERESELKGIGRQSWKSAAKEAADRLTKWVRNLRASAPGGRSS